MALETQCSNLRALVNDCLAKHLYDAAYFFADKLVSMAQHAPAEVYILAQVKPILNSCVSVALIAFPL